MTKSTVFLRGTAAVVGLYLALLIVSAALVHAAADVDEDTFVECSSHCGNEHEGERYDMKLCLELCRLFDFTEHSSLDY